MFAIVLIVGWYVLIMPATELFGLVFQLVRGTPLEWAPPVLAVATTLLLPIPVARRLSRRSSKSAPVARASAGPAAVSLADVTFIDMPVPDVAIDSFSDVTSD